MANNGHTRDTNARRKTRLVTIAAPVSVLATLAVVGIGVLGADPHLAPDAVSANQTSISDAVPPRTAQQPSRSKPRAVELERNQLRVSAQYSRSADRLATTRAVKRASSKMWTTETLNLWDSPTDEATKVGAIDAGKQVLVTGGDRRGRCLTLGDRRIPGRRETDRAHHCDKAVGRVQPVNVGEHRFLHQWHLRAQWGQPQRGESAPGGLCPLPRDHHLRHLSR